VVRLIIFDLDNCLAPADAIGRQLFDPAFAAIREANAGMLSEAALAAAFADCWLNPFDWVASQHGFSDQMHAAGWAAMAVIEVKGSMQGYDDLSALQSIPVKKALVTSGFRRLQQSKIDALNLASAFEDIFIDAIDARERLGKLAIFRSLLAAQQLAPDEVLVVGDSAHSELAAGVELGIPTVQTLRPRVARAHNATYTIHSLDEIGALLS
jgi:FMN phosphatase YigB (HAD superfamily)